MTENVLLNPRSGDQYIARPGHQYDLLMTVNSVDKNGVSVTTNKHRTDMMIPIKDWNRHIRERIIKKAGP
jgi:hypothetical protein